MRSAKLQKCESDVDSVYCYNNLSCTAMGAFFL